MAVSKNRRRDAAASDASADGEVERLNRELERYRQLLDLAPMGYVAMDADGVVDAVTRVAAELLGRGEDELVGRPIDLIVGDERRERVRGLIGEGAEWRDEVPFVDADGGRVRLVVHSIPLSGEGHTATAWALTEPADPLTGSARDRSREFAEAHRIERHRLSALLDRLHIAVAAVDSSLRVSYANSAAERLFGAGLVGTMLPDPWPEASLRLMAARTFEHGAEAKEAQVALEDGRAFEVLVLSPDASGEALLVITDVSAGERRRRAEREFVANAAHQLRTPVAAIASSIEVLQGGAKEVPETRDRFLAHLDRETNRLVRLTRALLQLARAQALDEPPAVEIVRMRSLLDGIALALRPNEGVEVRVECSLDTAALVNRDLLEQALGNLAENAAKYTQAGEIVLCAEDVSDERVRVVVSDTGPGAELPNGEGFARFYRDPAAQGEGFGIGLAIAAEAFRALGGELELESSELGTRAQATLPAARVRAP